MKKLLIAVIIIAGVIIGVYGLAAAGVINIESFADTQVAKEQTFDVRNIKGLTTNTVYVYHGDNLEEDAKGNAETKGTFEKAGFTTASFKVDSTYKDSGADKTHILWVSSKDEAIVPVLDANRGDKLVYSIQDTTKILPISCERFISDGYTIGISNMAADAGNHCYFTVYKSKDEAAAVINPKSDANQLSPLGEAADGGTVYLDAIGDTKVTGDSLSTGGTVSGLEKDKKYVCTFYTGTYYQDYAMTADFQAFSGYPREFFKWKDYQFLHSNIIEISLPSYLKSGYYLINGVGLIRYVAEGDTLDSPTDSPIVIIDEDGQIENPEVFGDDEDLMNAGTSVDSSTTDSFTGDKVDAAEASDSKAFTYEATGRFSATFSIGGTPVINKMATLTVIKPDGSTDTATEENGLITYTAEMPGRYAFNVTGIAGRTAEMTTEKVEQ